MIKHIKVIDGYPGIGKTSWAIQEINNSLDRRIIFCTPFRSEVDRIVEKCKEQNFVQPIKSRGRGRKMNDLLQLIGQNRNIATTHALFNMAEEELINSLRDKKYVLIIDEAQQVINKYDYLKKYLLVSEDYHEVDERTQSDFKTLINRGVIKIEENTGKVIWLDDEFDLKPYRELMNECKKGRIYSVNNSTFFWTFPVEIFTEDLFTEIYLMTHRFDSLQESYFFKYFQIPYEKYFLYKKGDVYSITKDERLYNEEEWKEQSKILIHIHNHQEMNAIGYNPRYENALSDNALSKNCYDNFSYQMKIKIRHYLQNYFGYYSDSKAREFYWTCFLAHQNTLRSKNVTPNTFLAVNARATNEKRECKSLAYMVNRFIGPSITNFFSQGGLTFNQDEWALSELIQWIWRSRIREGKDINIYLPSRRMRNLLTNYFRIEFDEGYYKELPKRK